MPSTTAWLVLVRHARTADSECLGCRVGRHLAVRRRLRRVRVPSDAGGPPFPGASPRLALRRSEACYERRRPGRPFHPLPVSSCRRAAGVPHIASWRRAQGGGCARPSDWRVDAAIYGGSQPRAGRRGRTDAATSGRVDVRSLPCSRSPGLGFYVEALLLRQVRPRWTASPRL